MFAAVKLGAVVVAAKAPNGCVLWTCCIFLQFLGVAVTLYMYLLLAYEFEGRFGLEKKCIPILDVDNLHVQLPDTNIYINYLEGCRLVIYGYGPVMNNFCSHKL